MKKLYVNGTCVRTINRSEGLEDVVIYIESDAFESQMIYIDRKDWNAIKTFIEAEKDWD